MKIQLWYWYSKIFVICSLYKSNDIVEYGFVYTCVFWFGASREFVTWQEVWECCMDLTRSLPVLTHRYSMIYNVTVHIVVSYPFSMWCAICTDPMVIFHPCEGTREENVHVKRVQKQWRAVSCVWQWSTQSNDYTRSSVPGLRQARHSAARQCRTGGRRGGKRWWLISVQSVPLLTRKILPQSRFDCPIFCGRWLLPGVPYYSW